MAAARSAAGPSTSKKVLAVDGYSNKDQNDKDLDRIAEADELFDAVLTGSVDQDNKVATNESASNDTLNKDKAKSAPEKRRSEGNASRKLSLYIGNFPWWTSDRDVLCLAERLGVKDVKDIKFAENKVNGQSRGYAEVVVTSEESLKILLEKVPQCKLHGESIDCRFATLQNLSIFEETAIKRIHPRVDSKDPENTESSFPSLTQDPSLPPVSPHFPPYASRFSNLFLSHPPPFFPHIPSNIPPTLPPTPFPPPPFHVLSQPSSSHHINPAMFTPRQDGHSSKTYNQQKHHSSGADFEELMNRNRAVASTAITKAVSSATTGDLQIGMETLLTAIAIIKQSRVYEDECCQALVTSLKDCLMSIQENCGHSRSRSRSKDRDRGRDRERGLNRERDRGDPFDWESAGTSRRCRERSWSRERERERRRSRERERHRDHRDRYR